MISIPSIVRCAHKEMVNVDLLTPNPKNPNRHPDNQIKLLAKIMAYQGWRSPIVVSNLSGFIIKGHGRLMAARLNGWKEAPVDRQDYASEADEYADMVADNKIAELSETDHEMIKDAILDIADFDLDLLGITDFSFLNSEPLELLPPNEVSEDDKQHVLEVMFRNPMELRDLYDDLISKGFMAKIKGGA